jgi:histidyl-tRNA synthetase
MVQLAKGVRDFAPNEKIARNYLVRTLKSIFEAYGFNPLETPIIERFETLSTKDSGSEILKEVFRFKDQGQRELALRFDLTVPFSRFVAMNPNLKMPFKRYQVGRVFRDGPIKLGRYREFWQCDVDVVGSSRMIADAEILSLAKKFFEKINLDVKIIVNNIKLINAIVEKAGVSKELIPNVLQTVDKLEKLGTEKVKQELLEKGFENADEILRLLDVPGDNREKFDYYSEILPDNEGLKELKEIFSLTEGINFAPELARGLSYYTGTVFEVKLKNKNEFSSSLAGGGRYDKMIGNYADNGKDYPAVGIAFGLEPILEVLKLQNKIELKNTVTKVFIVPIGDVQKEVLEIATQLRENKINTDVDLMNRKIPKNLKYVEAQQIPFALFVGENEIKEGKFKLKNMIDKSEEVLELSAVIEKLK